MKGGLVWLILYAVACNSFIQTDSRHLSKRHLTPLGSVLRQTAGKLLNPLGIGYGGSEAQSHSFSIGGSFLGKKY